MAPSEEILHAVRVVLLPGQVAELRAFRRTRGTRSGYFDDPGQLATVAEHLSDDPEIASVTVTLNPVDPALLARSANTLRRFVPKGEATSDANIVRRRWLLVDLDPVRSAGTSATDAEKSAACERAEAIAAWLAGRGWPSPLIADSGNGYHLLYRVDLPNDEAMAALIARCLAVIDDRWSDPAVSVDTAVGNAARLCKIYGTVCRKGDNVADRPWRRSALLSVPDPVREVPAELLQTLAGEDVTNAGLPTDSALTTSGRAGRFDLAAWFEKHAAALPFRAAERPVPGYRHVFDLIPCPWGSGAHEDGAYCGQRADGALFARCFHQGCGGATGPNRWHDLRDLVEPGWRDAAAAAHEAEPGQRILPFFEHQGRLYIVAITEDDRFGFIFEDADGIVRFEPTVTLEDGTVVLPRRLDYHQDTGELVRVVGLPRADLVQNAPVLTPHKLFKLLAQHVTQYADLPAIELEIGIYYALYTWFYHKRWTSPYLRYRADHGSGKSRLLQVFGDLCFLPINLTGGSSTSAIMRTHEKWRGTVLIDESDLRGDTAAPLIKFLNIGLERGKYLVLSDKNDPTHQQTFEPFGPKVIAMREPFRDPATESRCLSYSPRETDRTDIPPELPKAYREAVEVLRAHLARFVLHHWPDVDGEHEFRIDGVEPRIRQMASPIAIVLQLCPDGEERYRAYVRRRQDDVQRTRAESDEGQLFNHALALASVDPDTPDAVEAVTPRLLAEAFKRSAMWVTRRLQSIGFVSERRYIAVWTKEGERRRQQVRVLVVPSQAQWDAIVRRYYHAESDDAEIDVSTCPDILRSAQWVGSELRSRHGGLAPGTDGETTETGKTSDVAGGTGLFDHDPERWYPVQAHPTPCSICGRTPSHYVSGPSPLVTDSRNRFCCGPCHRRLNPEADQQQASDLMPGDRDEQGLEAAGA